MGFSRTRAGSTFPTVAGENLFRYVADLMGPKRRWLRPAEPSCICRYRKGYQGIMNIMSGMSMFGFISLIVSDWADWPCERTSMDHGTMIPPIGL